MTMRISPEERAMIKEAAKTVEYHDSRKSVREKAKKIASLIKSSKHCVAFTGAGISTAAGIGLCCYGRIQTVTISGFHLEKFWRRSGCVILKLKCIIH